MGQVTIYLDDETEMRMKEAADAAHLSKSKWIARVIRQNVAGEWPEDVAILAGAWKDFPSLDDIRKNEGSDAAREEF